MTNDATNLIQSIRSDNMVEATKIFNEIMSAKASERLETQKINVASKFFEAVTEKTDTK